jgi:hypothetical protein
LVAIDAKVILTPHKHFRVRDQHLSNYLQACEDVLRIITVKKQ